MKRYSIFLSFIMLSFCCTSVSSAQPRAAYNLRSDSLASRWDEAVPLGNGWIGALIWQKENKVRLSLDRVDLWDDRPMVLIDRLKFKWVVEQVHKNHYDTVHTIGDEPYDQSPAPTKIPAAALEFNCASFGDVVSNELDIGKAVSSIQFQNGAVFTNYVHAISEIGYFEIKNLPEVPPGMNGQSFLPEIEIPSYTGNNRNEDDNSHSGGGLQTLGYKKGTVVKTGNSIRYHQPTWKGNYYEVLVQWKMISSSVLIGSWTISNNKKAFLPALQMEKNGLPGLASHIKWWSDFWNKSSVEIPDPILSKQYNLEIYKMGCVARNNTPPVSLQAIWTADNGSLPPWKGDIHNDLNTELSYWPFYSGNHLDQSISFTNWLWKTKEQNKKWTKNYFGIDGLNVPGVTTISGKEMGGWIQYSMSPTTVAWLSQHFYWQWKYSMDKSFLLGQCKPYFDEAYRYFSKILLVDSVTGLYKLPLSSSPEIYDNTIKAWFTNWTNYDLSLVQSFYDNYIEVCKAATGKDPMDIERERQLLPKLDINETGLTIAPGVDLFESHRHLSPYMAIYPLSLLDIENEEEKNIIERSLQRIEEKGTRAWCGYSFSWMASIYAKAGKGDSAQKMLQIFASNFCSPNSFHLNGDQKGGQYSNFTYRPFTLEGNFAFAQGVHEMLLQSDKNYIHAFPAVPEEWKKVAFTNLRAQGAFLISAKKENGIVEEVKIVSEKGGLLRLKLPFKTFLLSDAHKKFQLKNGILEFQMSPNESITVKPVFE